MYLGAKYGMGAGQGYFSPAKLQAQVPGYSSGLSFIYMSRRLVGIHVEANYTQKGWREISDTSSYFYERMSNYAELPLMTHLRLGKKNLQVYLEAGSQLSYRLADNERISPNVVLPDSAYSLRMRWGYKFNFSLLGGAGVSYHFGATSVFVEARYCHTLTDLVKIEKYEEIETQKWAQHQFFVVSAGVMIRLMDKKEK